QGEFHRVIVEDFHFFQLLQIDEGSAFGGRLKGVFHVGCGKGRSVGKSDIFPKFHGPDGSVAAYFVLLGQVVCDVYRVIPLQQGALEKGGTVTPPPRRGIEAVLRFRPDGQDQLVFLLAGGGLFRRGTSRGQDTKDAENGPPRTSHFPHSQRQTGW